MYATVRATRCWTSWIGQKHVLQWHVPGNTSSLSLKRRLIRQFLGAIGRKASIINLDPANDKPPYDAAVDIQSLVTLQDVMESEGLGPNGGIVYALEVLEENFDWLVDQLAALGGKRIRADRRLTT